MKENKKYTEIMKQLNYKPVGSVLLRLCGVMCSFISKPKKEDTGLRGTYQGRLYVDKKVFYKRKCVQDNINSVKRWYYQNYT
jgi:hypothetical protein